MEYDSNFLLTSFDGLVQNLSKIKRVAHCFSKEHLPPKILYFLSTSHFRIPNKDSKPTHLVNRTSKPLTASRLRSLSPVYGSQVSS